MGWMDGLTDATRSILLAQLTAELVKSIIKELTPIVTYSINTEEKKI
jgi:hypothetical protein